MEKFSKFIFVFSVLALCLIGGTYFGIVSQKNDLLPARLVNQVGSALDEVGSDLPPGHYSHVQPSRGQGNGVTVNRVEDNDDFVLLVGFFEEENQVRLIRRDGSVQAKWSLGYFDHFPQDAGSVCRFSRQLDTDMHGALLTPKGELLVNYEYCGTVKLDHCDNPIWTLNEDAHHSITAASRGGYWVLGREVWSTDLSDDHFPPFSTASGKPRIQEDTLILIDDDGKIRKKISLPKLMYDAGLTALLTANGTNFDQANVGRSELIHTNKAAELTADLAAAFPLFEAGDIAISMRNINTVMVINPDTLELKWHQTGPWIRQHDPEFRPDGRISIFNNNVYRNAYLKNHTILSSPRTTNIMSVDPSTGDTRIEYGSTPGQEMLSVIRGQHELLSNDGILITEFDAGRVLEINAEREVIWEYVNAYNDDYVGEITNAFVFPRDYFETLPGSAPCP